jgi:hypothetical protein
LNELATGGRLRDDGGSVRPDQEEGHDTEVEDSRVSPLDVEAQAEDTVDGDKGGKKREKADDAVHVPVRALGRHDDHSGRDGQEGHWREQALPFDPAAEAPLTENRR